MLITPHQASLLLCSLGNLKPPSGSLTQLGLCHYLKSKWSKTGSGVEGRIRGPLLEGKAAGKLSPA